MLTRLLSGCKEIATTWCAGLSQLTGQSSKYLPRQSTLYGVRRERARDACASAFMASNAAVRRRPVQLRAALLQITVERQSNTKTSTVVVKSARAAPWKTRKEWGLLAVAAVARQLLAEAPVVPEVNPYRPCFFQTQFWMDWPLSFAMISIYQGPKQRETLRL
jgi:hypothetical protein